MEKKSWILKEMSLQDCIDNLYCILIKSKNYNYTDDEFNSILKAIDELQYLKELEQYHS